MKYIRLFREYYVLVLFTIFVGCGVFFTINFVKSEYFAGHVKKYLMNSVLLKSDIKLDFKKVDIGFFPPLIALDQIEIKSSSKQFPELLADRLSMRIGPRDIFAAIPTITYVEISGMVLNIPTSKKSNKVSSKQIEKVIQKFERQLPVKIRNVIVRNAFVTHDRFSTDIKKAQLSLLDNILLLNCRALETDIKGHTSFDGVEVSLKLRRGGDKIVVNRYAFSKLGLKVYGALEYNDSTKKIEKGNFTFDGELKGLRSEILPYLDFDIPNISGSGLISAKIEKGKYKTEFLLKDVASKYLLASDISGKADLGDSEAFIKRLNVKFHNGGEVNLIDQTMPYLVKGARLEVSAIDANLKDVIYYLRDNIEGFDLKYSGTGFLEFEDVTSINLNLDGSVKDLYLKTMESSQVEEILRVPSISNAKGVLNITSKKTNMKYDLKWGDEYVSAQGFVSAKEANFIINDSFFSLNRFDNIGGLKFGGKAKVRGGITSEDLRDVKVEILGSAQGYTIDKYLIKKIDFDVLVDSKKSEVVLNKVVGNEDGISFETKGMISILPQQNSSLRVKYKFDDPSNIRQYLEKIGVKTHRFVDEITGRGEGKVLVQGDFFNPKKVSVNASVNIDEFYIEREKFKSLKAQIDILGENISLAKVNFKKGLGDINFQFETKNLIPRYSFKINNVLLLDFSIFSEIGLGYNASLSLEASGFADKDFKNFKHKGKISLVEDGKNRPLNSYADYSINSDGFNFDMDILNSQSKIKLDLPFVGKGQILMYAKSDRISDLMSALQNHNKGKDVNGKIDVDAKFSIKDFNLKTLSGDVKINDFFMRYKTDKVLVSDKYNEISIIDGEIKGPIRFLFNDSIVQTEFLGDLNKDFLLNLNGTIPLVWLEFANKYIVNAVGDLNIVGRTEFKNHRLKNDYKLSVVDGQFSPVKNVMISDISVDARVDNNRINVVSAKVNYGGGTVISDGMIELDFPYPDINIDASVIDVSVKPKKKSLVVINGKAKLSGKRPPYMLQGDFTIPKSRIGDSIDEFSGGKDGISNTNYNPYVPYQSGSSRELMFFDTKFNLVRPFEISNSLADLKIEGGGRIKGGMNNFLISGQFFLVPFQSKVIFKGQDFVIYEGKVNFVDGSDNMPSVSLIGYSSISQYRIMLDASGPLDDLRVKFSSEPYLSQNDIISLITLGITSEISQKITENERDSITSVGLGSLVVDQLKLNEGLSDALGVKLSVLPEFESDDSSLLQERVGGQSSSIRPSTKLKVQKKINDDVTASVTSTLSGADESQKMSVDYMINKKVSLQGLYEINNSGSETSDDTSSSVGADIKFRWEF